MNAIVTEVDGRRLTADEIRVTFLNSLPVHMMEVSINLLKNMEGTTQDEFARAAAVSELKTMKRILARYREALMTTDSVDGYKQLLLTLKDDRKKSRSSGVRFAITHIIKSIELGLNTQP
jgi:hypothetical protein